MSYDYNYPEPLHTRNGCKVRWYYYATEAEAKIAAEVAVCEAADLERLGFDWGYQCPGAIRLTKGNEFNPGTYEVCVP